MVKAERQTTGVAHDAETQRKIMNRLRRAQGQLNAVIAAADSGANCRDVVTQLSAVTSALERAGFAIIASAMRECVMDEAEAGAAGAAVDSADSEASCEGESSANSNRERLTVEELEKLFMSLA